MSERGATFRWIAFFRSVAGFILAPPLAAAIVGGLSAAAYGNRDGVDVDVATYVVTCLSAAGMSFVAGAIVGIPVALIAGWPVHLLLLQIHFTGLFVYGCFAGSVSVMAMLYVFGVRFEPRFTFTPLPLDVVFAIAATGWLAGAIFWLVRRPDEDTKARTSPA